MTGRPPCKKRLEARNQCLQCGQEFTLDGKRFESLGRFKKRKFCSRDCAHDASRKDFWLRLEKAESGCWVWKGRRHWKGYGLAIYKGKQWRAHRLAYTIAKGAIPEGMMILHSCDNPPCCNPEHLRVGTAKENRADAISRGRLNPRGAIGPRIALSDEALVGTLKQAAQKFGCGKSTIWRFRKFHKQAQTANLEI